MAARDSSTGDVQRSQDDISMKQPHIDSEVLDSTASKPSHGDLKKPERNADEKDSEKKPPSKSRILASKIWTRLAHHFQWVSPNNTWSKWKPVIRCALAAWIGAIIFIVPTSETTMGQVNKRVPRLNPCIVVNCILHRPAS